MATIEEQREAADLKPLFAESRAACFGFTLSGFSEMLNDVLSTLLSPLHSPMQRQAALQNLRLDDLVLARACARGNQAAWDRFLLLYRDKLHHAALAITRENSTACELADSLYADLFGTRTHPDGSRISRLDSYLGRGSLEGWLKVVLAQQYVNGFRARRKLVAFNESQGSAEAEQITLSEPEMVLLVKVTDAVLHTLPPDSRFILAAYYLDGKTLAEIGRMLNAHESTIKRRLDKTIDGVRKAILAGLRQAGIRNAAAKAMLQLDVRDLGINIRGRLAPEQ